MPKEAFFQQLKLAELTCIPSLDTARKGANVNVLNSMGLLAGERPLVDSTLRPWKLPPNPPEDFEETRRKKWQEEKILKWVKDQRKTIKNLE